MQTKSALFAALGLGPLLLVPARSHAQENRIRTNIRGGGGDGKCTFEVEADEVAEVEIRGIKDSCARYRGVRRGIAGWIVIRRRRWPRTISDSMASMDSTMRIWVDRRLPGGFRPRRWPAVSGGRGCAHAIDRGMWRSYFLATLCILPPVALGQQVSFDRDIRPIMSDTCFRCHGPDASSRMANMRLDIREEALKPKRNGTPIVPGDTEHSEIIQRVFAKDGRIMPPPFAHKELTETQKNTIRRWVEQGAKYETHWAYAP